MAARDVRTRHDDYVRAYRHEHPVALWLSLGIGVVGVIGLIFPATIEQTATSLALPHWLRILYYAMYAVGGLTMWWGLHKARFNTEAAGEVVLSSALLAQFASLAYLRPESAVPGLFVLFLAIGCLRRAWHLSRRSQ